MVVVRAAAAYRPAYHLNTDELAAIWGRAEASGIERKAVAGPDEDSLTMAVAAARRLFSTSGTAPDDVGTLAFATTRPPLAEEELTPRIGAALGLADDYRSYTATASTAAGGDAVRSAADAVKVGHGPALVLVADAPRGDLAGDDHRFGAGAAAFLLAADGDGARLVDSASYSQDAPGGRFREGDSDETRSLDIQSYDRATARTCVEDVTSRLDGGGDADICAIHQPDAKQLHRLAVAAGATDEARERGTVVDTLGDAGAATVPFSMATGLVDASDGESCLALFFGSGAKALGFRFVVEGGVAGHIERGDSTALSFGDYLRFRDELGEISVSGGGAHVSLPSWQRSIEQRYLLRAGRCLDCGAVVFPPQGACTECHERDGYEDVTLCSTGTVEAVTDVREGGAPPEFVPHQRRGGTYAVALVTLELEDGAGSVRIPAQLTDCDPDAVTSGATVRSVWRRIYVTDSVPRYGLKFALQPD